MSYIRNKLGRISGFGGCARCGDSWSWKEHHSTPYESGSGCFPLCEECWRELSPEERLPYYRELWLKWMNDFRTASFDGREEAIDEYAATWPKIKAAVLNGL